MCDRPDASYDDYLAIVLYGKGIRGVRGGRPVFGVREPAERRKRVG
jgi:hypothetical protein